MFKLEDTKGWGLTKWWPSDCLRITFSHICNSSAKPLAHQLLIFKLFSGNLETLLYPSQKPPETHPKSVTSLFSKTNLLTQWVVVTQNFRGNSQWKWVFLCFLFVITNKATSYLSSAFLGSALSKDANMGWNIFKRPNVRTVCCHREKAAKENMKALPTN